MPVTTITQCSFRCLALVALAGLCAVPAAAEVPPRTAAAQTLEVPPAVLERSEVYYLLPGQDGQLVLTSETPLLRLVATTSRAVGYVAAPFDYDEAEVPLVAGALRIPVASLRAGSGAVDQFLREELLDSVNHPEITFELTGVRDVEPAGMEKDVFRYHLTLVGKLGVQGVSKEVAVPAEVTFLLTNQRTMNRYVGDLLTIRGELGVARADFGLEVERPDAQGQVAETIGVDLFLLFSTVTPDKSWEFDVRPEQWAGERRFLTLVRDFDPEAGYAFGRNLLQEYWDDGRALGRIARLVVDDPDLRQRDLAFAMKAAQRANELAEGKEARPLGLVARICHLQGQLAAAVEWQKKAVAALPEGAPPEAAEAAQAALKRYQEDAKRHAE